MVLVQTARRYSSVQRPSRTQGRRTLDAGAHSSIPKRSASAGSQGAYGGQLQPESSPPGPAALASTSFLTPHPGIGRVLVMVGTPDAGQERR